jgi:hypothetical protein
MVNNHAKSARKWALENPDKVREYIRRYREKHMALIVEKQRAYRARKRAEKKQIELIEADITHN